MALPTVESMYKAVAQRDKSQAGAFFIAVKSTGIFCVAGCPARTPLLKNLEFFSSAKSAMDAGYRPCLRCHPLDAGLESPSWARKLLGKVEQDRTHKFRDRDLRALGLQPETVRRYFKRRYGMTFQAYCRAVRLGAALKEIREGKNSTEAAMDAGYLSDSGFRDAFERFLGKSVGHAQDVEVISVKWLDTPVGAMLAGATNDSLCLLEFVDRRMLETQIKVLQGRFKAKLVPGGHAVLDQTERELKAYFARQLREFTVPLIYPGTDFQVKVWKRLLEIPYGVTQSYGMMARDLGSPDASRAVGKANGDNRIAIIIPCHRVIKSDGSLCGYGGGLWRKQKLLDLEMGKLQDSLF